MPAYGQAAFLPRAVGSLLVSTLTDWELVVVDDGSPDDVAGALGPFRPDSRIRLLRLPVNRGLGAALNAGLAAARAPLVAYLPCDDLYDPGHLAALLAALADPGRVLVWSGVRHHDGATALDGPLGDGLQLVQVMHRRTSDRWMERSELESDDLELLLFAALRRRGGTGRTGIVSCTWTDHPGQRHKAIRRRDDGGVNVFRRRYRVPQPLRLHSRDAGLVDEVGLYARFRERSYPADPGGLHVLLVGELSYNAERVLALAERGVRLSGLWTSDGLGYNTVGPLPFGHVTDLPGSGWRAAVRAARPDVIYAQLDWRAVPFALEVLRSDTRIPFVWHFKESPQRCIARGEWPQLAELCTAADAVVLSTPQERGWFDLALPGRLDPATTLVLDGSLPKVDWFAGAPAKRLSERDGAVHTAVLGRPIGLDAQFVAAVADRGVHVHFHGLADGPGPEGGWRRWLDDARGAVPGHVHVHPGVDQRGWVERLSRYDAGWMHRIRSGNAGDLRGATWDDLNHPARIGTLMAAGLPMLQQHSPGSTVAVDALIEATGAGLLYGDVDDLGAALAGPDRLARARDRVAAVRDRFTFDAHIGTLIALLERVSGRS
jgi:hypothetical protein